ncbi:hypothetical protein Taro_004300 [Colocasia esculenta]|uniref:Uncharacterized protein n=1 Tax=Colocasia esculenta TaxID=4460 RepID=A0A843TPL8_COLES|nr:hypothetical protein [Colocasia esculenta]
MGVPLARGVRRLCCVLYSSVVSTEKLNDVKSTWNTPHVSTALRRSSPVGHHARVEVSSSLNDDACHGRPISSNRTKMARLGCSLEPEDALQRIRAPLGLQMLSRDAYAPLP